MEVVENTLDVDLEVFLDRPLFCFLATTENGAPRISPLWFLWENGCIWIIADARKTYPERVTQNDEAALAIVNFELATGTVEHVGMRGQATVEPHDPARAERLLSKYLGPEKDGWDESRFPDPSGWGDEMVMIRFVPETVVARDQSYTAS